MIERALPPIVLSPIWTSEDSSWALPARQLVGLHDRTNGLDPRNREHGHVDQILLVSDAQNDGSVFASDEMRAGSQGLDSLPDVVELFVGHAGSRDNNHGSLSLCVMARACDRPRKKAPDQESRASGRNATTLSARASVAGSRRGPVCKVESPMSLHIDHGWEAVLLAARSQ